MRNFFGSRISCETAGDLEMKILKLRLENIKCFKEIEIPFESVDGSARNWSLFVGDNGQGKTTILRSLAMGLCDKEGASALRAELHGEFLRRDTDKGSIQVCLKDENNKEYTVKTWIKLEDNGESISQDVFLGDCVNKKGKHKEAKDFKRDRIFAVAYGAGRSVAGTESYEEYSLVDSLYTLFNYEHTLQNAELGASRVKINAETEWKRLQEILRKVLMLDDKDEISLERTGLYINYFNTDRGEDFFHVLSDGYKSLASVVLDFISWNLIYKLEAFDLNNLSGILILDELEQHLHPKWQREIIKILSDQFPKVQFICSTHTPICALGLSDLECESRLFKVAYVNGHSDIDGFDLKKQFKGYRADQILTSSIFDLTDTRSVSAQDKLKEYREIYLKEKRGDQDGQRMEEIEEELGDFHMWNSEKEKIRWEKLIELLENQQRSSE